MIKASILSDSMSLHGIRLTTFELVFPRYILPQVLTHRVFSRNTSSSRAIPINRMIRKVEDNPATPKVFYKNKKGMQSHDPHERQDTLRDLYATANKNAVLIAKEMSEMGVHKQHVNRLIEPFSHTIMVLSATDFDNFFNLRISEHSQHEIHDLAVEMKKLLDDNEPSVPRNLIHLPYATEEEKLIYSTYEVAMISAARCARVSWQLHR